MTILICNICEKPIHHQIDNEIFCQCRRKRLTPEDAKSVCDSPNPDNKKNQGDIEKSISANCPRCTFPKKGKNQRIYCMCD